MEHESLILGLMLGLGVIAVIVMIVALIPGKK